MLNQLEYYISKIKTKTYIDIGGGPPIEGSNTYNLYQNGWSGVVYEPNDVLYRKYNTIRPLDIVINAAVLDYNGDGILYVPTMPGYSTTKKPNDKLTELCKTFKEISVNIVDAADISGHFGLLSLDAEGQEDLILNRIDYSKFSFELAIIESYSPADYLETYKKFEPRLIDHGYEFLYEISVNRIYRRKNHD